MKESYRTMNQFILNRRIGAAALGFGMLALSGCAAFAPATPEQVVEKRALAYWKARMAGQYEKAYALSTPSYRKLYTDVQFRSQFGAGVNVESAEVTKVACEAEKCIAQLKLGVKPALLGVKMGTIPTYVDDTWLLEDGQWWHFQEP